MRLGRGDRGNVLEGGMYSAWKSELSSQVPAGVR